MTTIRPGRIGLITPAPNDKQDYVTNKGGISPTQNNRDSSRNIVGRTSPQHKTKNVYHPICRAVSFEEGEIAMKTTTAIKPEGRLLRLFIKSKPQTKVSILQRRMQQLRVQLEGTKRDLDTIATLPSLTNWGEIHRAFAKGDKSRRSSSISRQRLEMRTSHHRKKGIAGLD